MSRLFFLTNHGSAIGRRKTFLRLFAAISVVSVLFVYFASNDSSGRSIIHRPTIHASELQKLTSLPRVFNCTSSSQSRKPFYNSTQEILSLAIALVPNAKIGDCRLTRQHLERYESLLLTEQASSIYIAVNLINAEAIIPNFLVQLAVLVEFLGHSSLHVSVYENGSLDNTPFLLHLLSSLLHINSVSYSINAKGTTIPAADKKMKMPRIPTLASVRNNAIADIWGLDDRRSKSLQPPFDTVLFMNDIFWCPADVLELLLQKQKQGANMVCSTDWESGIIWDRWVLRDISGRSFYKVSELTKYFYGALRFIWRPIPSFLPFDRAQRTRFAANLPIQVFSCWNGMVAMTADAFLEPFAIRFRTARNDPTSHVGQSDKESECFLICVDFWKSGFRKILITRRSSVAYNYRDYDRLRQDRDVSLQNFTRSEKIEWKSEPPEQIAFHDWAKWWNERWGKWNEA